MRVAFVHCVVVEMTLTDSQIRDLGDQVLLPEARSASLKTLAKINCVGSSSQLIVCVTESTVDIFSRSSLWGIVPGEANGKKGTLPVHNPRLDEKPVISITHKVETVTSCVFSDCERILFLMHKNAAIISYIDLTSGELLSVESLTIPGMGAVVWGNQIVYFNGKDCVSGQWVCENQAVQLSNDSFRVLVSQSELKQYFGKLDWILFPGVALASNSCVVVVDENYTCRQLSLMNGQVLNVRVGPTFVVIHQADAISVFQEGELLCQLRDTINKVRFGSMDFLDHTRRLVCLSNTDGQKNHLELFDIVGKTLSPVLRWDVTRLSSDETSVVRFISNEAFVSTVCDEVNREFCAIVWDSLVTDNWFSVMPNFKVLYKNEPYIESEEEFDFNQHAEHKVVTSSLNRYRSVSKIKFDFIDPQQTHDADLIRLKLETEDETMGQKPPIYAFMQPLKIALPTSPTKLPDGSTKVQFFSAQARNLLKRI